MKHILAFRYMSVDTQFLPAFISGEPLGFFNPGDHAEEEVITQKKKHEEEIIKWMLGTRARGLLLDELGVGPNSFVDYSVKRPIIENTQEKPGDIDILICDGCRAEHTTAIQCKAVTVVAFNQDEDDVNKLPDIKDAVLQANKQRDKYGFHRNYMAVLIKAYGRKRVGENVLFRGPSRETFKRIYEFPQRESLYDDGGIVFVEIVQPTGKSFKRMVNIGVCVDRSAGVLSQPARLTNRIREHMRLRGEF